MIAFLARCSLVVKRAVCLLGLFAGLESYTLNACKYSVRDVAFVDLSRQTFEFVTLAPSTELDDFKSLIRPVANAVFLDSNIRMSWISSDRASSHPAFKMVGSQHSSPTFCLYREGEDPFLFSSPDDVSSLKESELWAWLEPVVQSPIRQAFMKQLLEAYAVVLVVEGIDADENQRVLQAAQSASASIAKLIPEMPKPVDVPPQVVVVHEDDIQQEASLLWSLGLDWESPETPQAAVVIGRGRRLGPALNAHEVTATKLQEILAVAGQDCECDLDRSWMQGPMIPVRWGADREQAAYAALGFDPENPLVKAEISRILARGKNPIAGGNQDTIGTELDMLLLGYSEEVIDLGVEETQPEPQQSTQATEENISTEEETDKSEETSNHVSNGEGEALDTTQTESESDPKATTAVVTQTQTQPGAMRQILVVLAGFCVLALIGGLGVLIAGRKR